MVEFKVKFDKRIGKNIRALRERARLTQDILPGEAIRISRPYRFTGRTRAGRRVRLKPQMEKRRLRLGRLDRCS